MTRSRGKAETWGVGPLDILRLLLLESGGVFIGCGSFKFNVVLPARACRRPVHTGMGRAPGGASQTGLRAWHNSVQSCPPRPAVGLVQHRERLGGETTRQLGARVATRPAPGQWQSRPG